MEYGGFFKVLDYLPQCCHTQAQLAALTGESNRKMNEEDALIEEQAFMENLTKAELRESRALCSSLRVKLNFYGEEIARLRCVTMVAWKHQTLTDRNRTRKGIPDGI